jgi:hypothetical protein
MKVGLFGYNNKDSFKVLDIKNMIVRNKGIIPKYIAPEIQIPIDCLLIYSTSLRPLL